MDGQQQITIIAIVVAAFVILGLVWFGLRQQRRRQLRERFGPEYERVVRQEGDPSRAEHVLSERKARVDKLELRPLDAGLAMRLRDDWRHVQARFVDDPRGALRDADRLIADAMKARGYPVGDFEQRAADVSVDHAGVVSQYRSAHEIAQRPADRAATEDLRRAMVQYRALFAELVGGASEPKERRSEKVDEREEQLR